MNYWCFGLQRRHFYSFREGLLGSIFAEFLSPASDGSKKGGRLLRYNILKEHTHTGTLKNHLKRLILVTIFILEAEEKCKHAAED